MQTKTQNNYPNTDTANKYQEILNTPTFFEEGLNIADARQKFEELVTYLGSNYISKYSVIYTNFRANPQTISDFKTALLEGKGVQKLNKIRNSTSTPPEQYGKEAVRIEFRELTLVLSEMMELGNQIRRFKNHYPELENDADILLDKIDGTRTAVNCAKDILVLDKLDEKDPDSLDKDITEFKIRLINKIRNNMEQIYGKLDEEFARDTINSGDTMEFLTKLLEIEPSLENQWTLKLLYLYDPYYYPDCTPEETQFLRDIITRYHKKMLGEEIYNFLMNNLQRNFTFKEHFEVFKQIVGRLNANSDLKFQVVESDDDTFNVDQTNRVLEVPNKDMDGERLASMIFHEVLTHIARRQQDEKIHRFYEVGEEGLAVISQYAYKHEGIEVSGGVNVIWFALYAIGAPLPVMTEIYRALSKPETLKLALQFDFIKKTSTPINEVTGRRTNVGFYDENLIENGDIVPGFVDLKDQAYPQGRRRIIKLVKGYHEAARSGNLNLLYAIEKVLENLFVGKFDPTHYESAKYLKKSGKIHFTEEEWQEYRKFIEPLNREIRYQKLVAN